MQRLGVAVHVSKSGYIVVQLSRVPRIGDKVYDQNLKRIGVVKDVVGPVSNPFALVKPEKPHPLDVSGKPLYFTPSRSGR